MEQNFGYVRVASAVPSVRVGDCGYNAEQIRLLISQAVEDEVDVISFPELSITGYTCGDLFFTQQLQQDAMRALSEICASTRGLPIIVLVGAPVKVDNNLYNSAFVITDGELMGVVPKINLPNTGEFYEKRWFTSGRAVTDYMNSVLLSRIPTIELLGSEVPFGTELLFSCNDYCFGLEICEDLWSPLPPSTQLAIQGAELIFNLSSSNCLVGKHRFRERMITQQSARVHCGYVYTSSGIGESTTDVVFSGSTYIAENGELLVCGERFVKDNLLKITEIDVERLRTDRQRNTNFTKDQRGHYRKINVAPLSKEGYSEPTHRLFSTEPFLPSEPERDDYFGDILSIQTNALARRWEHIGCERLVVGVSGGLDSSWALIVAAKTADLRGVDRSKVLAVTMPGPGTTDRTHNNATNLMDLLHVEGRDMPITADVERHLATIGHNGQVHDTTYENIQSRLRTLLLMNLANENNGIVVGTGDMSELALGWTTFGGDQLSMYNVNGGLPKTVIRDIVTYAGENWFSREIKSVLDDILATPISPELLPADTDGSITQKTEDKVGPYELHDFFLYHFLRFGFRADKIAFMAEKAFADKYDSSEIKRWLTVFMKRFYANQFKRSCMPDGPKIMSVSLSPRGDWRMPSDAPCTFMREEV